MNYYKKVARPNSDTFRKSCPLKLNTSQRTITKLEKFNSQCKIRARLQWLNKVKSTIAADKALDEQKRRDKDQTQASRQDISNTINDD